MTGEFDLAGVYVHPLVITAILAFIAAEAIAWLLGRMRLYRFVWHRGLFDVALTILLWAGFASLLNGGNMAALFG
ncbi:DUF1656 domain-containing protein [Sphingomonas sp.]|uniref:DUF1656 domain-containing protein n=1 Tax=Sphingomonas sp. TaxID=28214 RepID=UPI0031CFDEB6